MSIKSKFYLYLLTGLIIVISFSTFSNTYIASYYLKRSISENLAYAVYSVSELIDHTHLQDIHPDSIKTAPYRRDWKSIKSIQTNLKLNDIYIITVNSNGRLLYAYNSADNPDSYLSINTNGSSQTFSANNPTPFQGNKGRFLTEYRNVPNEFQTVLKTKSLVIAKGYYNSDDGFYKPAFQPVTDKTGTVIAVIVAHYPIIRVFGMMEFMTIYFIVSLFLFLLFWLLIHQFLKKSIINPIQELNRHTSLIAQGRLENDIGINTKDEIGALAHNFNIMSHHLKDSFEKIQKSNDDLIHQLYTDRLTGIPNRRKLMEDLESCKHPVIMLLNIDSFQEINDFYSTIAGDFILLEIAKRLSHLSLGSMYRFYKMYADEYCILTDEFLDRTGQEIMGIYFSEGLIEAPFIYHDTEIIITISLGIGKADENENPAQAISNAEMALKQAKTTRKKYIIYHESMNIPKEYQDNIESAKTLKSAIRDGRIIPYFQPVVNNADGKFEKYECLVRLIASDGSVLGPYQFLKIAHKTRLYRYITKMMVDKSFSFFKEKPFEFSINLSLEDMLDDKTMSYILLKLKDNPDTAPRVIFEILETENIENHTEVKEFVALAKAFGCKFAVDDFGTGYSNFSHIIHLNIDYIKIDSSIIKNMNTDSSSFIIAKTIAEFARELGLKTVAEFVFNKEVYEAVLKLGIDYSQGYYFGEPKPGLH